MSDTRPDARDGGRSCYDALLEGLRTQRSERNCRWGGSHTEHRLTQHQQWSSSSEPPPRGRSISQHASRISSRLLILLQRLMILIHSIIQFRINLKIIKLAAGCSLVIIPQLRPYSWLISVVALCKQAPSPRCSPACHRWLTRPAPWSCARPRGPSRRSWRRSTT